MTVLLTLLGVALIVIVLRDIFHTLLHPAGTGALSSQGLRYAWRVFRPVGRRHPGMLALAGPVLLLLVVAMWTVGLIFGWALLLWPYLPEQFLLSSGLEPAANAGFRDALYLSTVSLTTLGYGDITPRSAWLRLVAPLEALVGFALMTASISWILSVYPVLSRRRNLALEVALLQRSGRWGATVAAEDGSTAMSEILSNLTRQIISVRNDYSQVSVTYYFHQTDRDAALDVALPHVVSVARQASRQKSASIQFQAGLLHAAVSDLATQLGESFLDVSDVRIEQVLTAYAADHLHRVAPMNLKPSEEDEGP